MREATFTFRVDPALKNEFSEAAKSHDRSAAQLLRDFMRSYVKRDQNAAEYDAWLRKKVEASMASVAAGNHISHEEMEAEAAEWRERAREKLAKGVTKGNIWE